jgi:hypothetical protein
MDEDDQQAARIAMIRRAHGFQDEHQVHVKKAALLLDAETHWEKTRNKHDRCNREFVRMALKSDKSAKPATVAQFRSNMLTSTQD